MTYFLWSRGEKYLKSKSLRDIFQAEAYLKSQGIESEIGKTIEGYDYRWTERSDLIN